VIPSLQALFRRCWRHPYLAAVSGLAVALAAGNYFLWQERAAAAARHEEAHRQGEEMLRALADYPAIASDLDAVTGAIQLIDQNLVVERALEVNLGYFYQMERVSRVHLRQINQLGRPPSPEGNPFRIVPFALQATGTYAQLINFMRNLESGPRLLRITSYNLSRGDPKSALMLLDLSVETLGHP
jgi:Tfp pilus assembly protein PilO